MLIRCPPHAVSPAGSKSLDDCTCQPTYVRGHAVYCVLEEAKSMPLHPNLTATAWHCKGLETLHDTEGTFTSGVYVVCLCVCV